MKDKIIYYHNGYNSRGRAGNGIHQHPISAKMDLYTWAMMQDEQRTSGVKINALLNLAVRWHLEELDEARRAAACGIHHENSEGGTKYNTLKYILGELTEHEADKMSHICRNLGMNVEDLPLHLIRRMLETYDEKPFLYL